MTTVSEQFTRFLARDISEHTRNKYYYRLRPFVGKFGEMEPMQVTPAMVASDVMSNPSLSEASRAILRACHHALWSFCGLDPNPAASLPHYRDTPKRITYPSEREVLAIMNQAITQSVDGSPTGRRDSLILVLSVMSGNRRGELRAVLAEEIETALRYPENGVYRAETTGKVGTAVIRFTSFHVPFMQRYNAVRPDVSPHYFVNLNQSHPRYGLQLSLVGFDRARLRLCDSAGVAMTYQELRRRLATHIARRQGVDIAAHALGHSPHSGDRVIRAFYYDPDKAAVDAACLDAFPME